jgi:diguanylate cyclase (GGDEF)-like protein
MRARSYYRLMLVEDNPADARLVREALSEHSSVRFEIVHFARIAPALTFFEQDMVDVLLLDYQLPDSVELDGLSRVIAAAPNLPIVMLTGVDDEEFGLQLMQQGAQDYLVKGSVNSTMLVRAIRHAIERKNMSDRMRDSEERFALAAAGSDDGIWDWHIPNDLVFLSPRAKAILSLPADTPEQSMKIASQRIHRDDIYRLRDGIKAHLAGDTPECLQQVRVGANDQQRWVLVRGLAVKNAKGEALRMAGSITDLTSLNIYYDSVTGLPSRALLIDRLLRALQRNRRQNDAPSALILISVVRYSLICETLGHAAADKLMIAVGQLVGSLARPGDMVGRVSTNELCMILEGDTDADAVTTIAGAISRRLLAPVVIDGHELVPTMRMGVVVLTPSYSDPEIVMRDAAAAVVADPAALGLPFCIFNPEMRQRASERLRIETVLRHAIERNALRLVYQPIVVLADGTLRGFEALLRLNDPDLGQVSPALFVPIAEEIGLIHEIGTWVLHTACRQIVTWRKRGLINDQIDFSVSVNLSGRQLDGDNAIDRILAVLTETGVPSRNLTLELTETALTADPERARDALMALKLHGVSLAMDDFGTGYSSLSYLGRFPFDKLKIDQSFVNTIAAGMASPLLKGMIGLTKELGLRAVAEGVETAEQRDVLKMLGCEDGQGWLFGRPLEIDAAEALLGDAARRWPIYATSAKKNVDAPIPADGAQLHRAAIVATEVVDYRRMTTRDTVGTERILRDIQSVIDPMIFAYRGRILGIAGGAYMLDFVSVVDAVSCAMAMQRAMAVRNSEQAAGWRMEFRIGINMGDILVRGGDVSGDGVSIATQLMALAQPGGICVSGKVYDDVATKLDLRFEDIGPQKLKNIHRLIHVFRATTAPPYAV